MSARSRKINPKLDLKLNLSPPKTCDGKAEENETADDVSSPSSCNSSCWSSTAEDHQDVGSNNVNRENSNRAQDQVTLATTSSPMVVLGCPRCLIYVMLLEAEPRCPQCKSTVLLNLFGEDLNSKKKTT